MALPIIARLIAKHGAAKIRKEIAKYSAKETKKIKKAKDKPLANVGGAKANKSLPRGTFKQTDKVKSESPVTSTFRGKEHSKDSSGQATAKVKRTQREMANNRRALNKASPGAGGRTRAQAKKAEAAGQTSESFGSALTSAKKAGKQTFKFGGRTYSTKPKK